MPRFDFKCEVCGQVKEFHVPHLIPPEEWPKCEKCNELMDRQWPRTSFKVKGFNAKNGYSNG